jgi:hypothetical protein
MSTPYGAFDLWYYDELAQQTEEIRLSLGIFALTFDSINHITSASISILITSN